MTITETIAWLRRLAVVSCPTITSQQAAEVAEMLAEQQRQVDGFRKATAERYAEVVEAVHEHDITKTELEASRTLAAKLYADLGIRTQERDAAATNCGDPFPPALTCAECRAKQQRRRDDINIADTKCMRCGIYTDSGVLCSACRVRGDK